MQNRLGQIATLKVEKNKSIKKTKNYIALKFFLYLICFFIFSSVEVMSALNPAIFGPYVSFSLLQNNLFIINLSYLVALIISGVSTWELVFYFFTIFVVLTISLIFKSKNKICKTYIITLISFVIGLVYCLFNTNQLYLSCINSILNVITTLCFAVLIKVIKQRKYNLNLQTDEIICLSLLLCLFFCGLNNLNVFVFDVVKFIGLTLVLFSIYLFPLSGTMLISVLGGLGASLSNGNIGYIALFSLVAIFGAVFKSSNKFLLCVTTLCIDLCITLFFNVFSLPVYYSVIPTLCACIIFLIVNKTYVESLKSMLFLENNNLSVKEIFNNDKLFLSQKLLFTSEVFFEMDKNFRNLLQTKLDEKTSKTLVCNEVLRENCENCENKTKCIKNFDREIKNVFQNLTNVGFEKGKITLLDLPAYLTNRCIKVNSIVNSYNSMLNKYKQFSRQKNNLDNSKLLIADQLKGVSNILKKLSDETKKEVVINTKLQEKVKESLIYNNIIPIEIVCFENDFKTNVVEILLRNIDFDLEKINEVLKNIYKTKMIIDDFKSLKAGEHICVRFVTAPIFDMSVGFCQSSKGGEDVCGDTFTLTKLKKDKILLGVCDGMGHGVKANKISETSINIIENFYKAGFDNETILTSVNSLLSLQQDENFTAIDVGVVDLKTGEISFIKQGATSSYILSKTKLFKIESSGLPLGILSEVKPKIVKTVLTPEDFVIIVSDGVSDSFKSDQNFEDFLSSLNYKNPQEMADSILKVANKNVKNYPNDDMTVLVGKLFYF